MFAEEEWNERLEHIAKQDWVTLAALPGSELGKVINGIFNFTWIECHTGEDLIRHSRSGKAFRVRLYVDVYISELWDFFFFFPPSCRNMHNATLAH